MLIDLSSNNLGGGGGGGMPQPPGFFGYPAPPPLPAMGNPVPFGYPVSGFFIFIFIHTKILVYKINTLFKNGYFDMVTFYKL